MIIDGKEIDFDNIKFPENFKILDLSKGVNGCIPLSIFNEPASDQPGCVSFKCQSCGELMWLSSKKRMLMYRGFTTACWFCIFSNIKAQGHSQDDFKMVDITKVIK